MNDVFQSIGLPVDWRFAFSFSGLIMARLAVVTAIFPFLVGKPVPNTIKMGFNLVMLLFLYPYLAPANRVLPESGIFTLLLFLKEAFYGLSIGIAASIVFHAFEAAGSVVDNQRGAAQARLLIPQLGEQSSIFGNFNFLFGIVIFLSIGGHLQFLRVLIESYDRLPILEFPKAQPDILIMLDEFIRMTGQVLLVAMQLTAPVIISIFVADVVLGIMSKTAPSINVWEMGFMLRGVIGVLVYFLAIGIMAAQMGKISLGMTDMVQRVIHLLSFSPSS